MQNHRPAAWIGLAGPYAFDPTTWPSTREIFAGTRPAEKTRPVTFVDKAAPPALLMHGANDKIVQLFNMRDMAGAMVANGRQVQAREISGIGHIGILTALSRPFRWRAPILDRVTQFINQLPASPVPAGKMARE